MSNIPRTADDFRVIGARFASEDIVVSIDRLLPVARTDQAGLLAHEYTVADRDQLADYRGQLSGESSERRLRREEKKGARRHETRAIRQGKRLLRAGAGVAVRAIARRQPGAGEDADTSAGISGSFQAQLDALGGRVGFDSAKLRTRMTSLVAILTAPELAPATPELVAARAARVAGINQAIAKLPTLAEAKKGLQGAALRDTAELDEIDGRAYFNLKNLCEAGRALHLDEDDRAGAAPYNLNDLHEATRRREDGKPPDGPTGAPTV